MKTIIRPAAAAICLLLNASCFDLQEDPLGVIAPTNFYETEADALASLVGAYQAVTDVNLTNLLNISGCVGFTIDSRFTYFMTGETPPTDAIMQSSWSVLYSGVRRSNTTIDRVSAMQNLEAATRDRIVAEGKFLRALYHFYLVRTWGEVPLRVGETNNANLAMPSASREEIFAQIVKDLDEAIPHLAAFGEVARGRATQGAGKALLAKVYLHMASAARCAASGNAGCAPYTVFAAQQDSFFQRARDLSLEVIEQSGFQLLPNWMDLWGIEHKTNDEFIFAALAITDDPSAGTSLSYLYTPINSPYMPFPAHFGGFSYEFVLSYDSLDTRFTDGMIWDYTDVTNGTYVRWIRDLYDPTKLYLESYYFVLTPKKYMDPTAKTYIGGASLPILRMADVYLMYAEAENELNGPTAEAFAKINAIRGRVNVPLLDLTTTPSKDALRDAIIQERLWELALEREDWFDLTRTGKLEEKCYNLSLDWAGRDPVGSHPRARNSSHYRFPYPANEVAVNPNLY